MGDGVAFAARRSRALASALCGCWIPAAAADGWLGRRVAEHFGVVVDWRWPAERATHARAAAHRFNRVTPSHPALRPIGNTAGIIRLAFRDIVAIWTNFAVASGDDEIRAVGEKEDV